MNRNYKSHTYFNGHIRNTKNLEVISQETKLNSVNYHLGISSSSPDTYIHPQIAKFINKYPNYLERLNYGM